MDNRLIPYHLVYYTWYEFAIVLGDSRQTIFLILALFSIQASPLLITGTERHTEHTFYSSLQYQDINVSTPHPISIDNHYH